MRRECRESFHRLRGLAIPTCITARVWRTCRDVCRVRQLAVSFEVSDEENVPGIPGACTTRNFAYPARGPLASIIMGIGGFARETYIKQQMEQIVILWRHISCMQFKQK